MTYKSRTSRYNLRNSEYGGSSGQIPSSGSHIPGAGEIYALPTPPPTPVKKGKKTFRNILYIVSLNGTSITAKELS